MFPTLVWRFELKADFRDAMDAKLVPLLGQLRRDRPALAAGQGWQSEQTLHARPELQDLCACVSHVARSILRFWRIGYDALEITGCWATVLAEGAMHRAHTHPNNVLSGVYYLRTPPGADTINFHDPRIQARVIRPPVVELTAENTDQVVVRVSQGTLLMFPSWLEHSVDASTSGQERISISFNLMYSAFAEHIGKPLW
ncbi:hypothetical protein GCM10027034_08770 [Ramlibacter solisilvae]